MKTAKELDALKKVSVSKEAANLPTVEVSDSTQTKGKVSGNFTIVNQTENESKEAKLDKNKVFAKVIDYFCPVKFDSSALETSLQPLVTSGILSEEAKVSAIEKEKKSFLEKNAEIISQSENLTFVEVIAKLKENDKLYNEVLNVCNVSEFSESEYIEDGKVKIYRGAQCTDKDGNNRYQNATVTKTENGKTFEQPLFVELREITTTNILLSIRYYQSKRDATRKLANKVSEYKKILVVVAETAKKAKENGFSLSQVTEAITKVFEDETTK